MTGFDTIFAVSTGSLPSAVSVIRVSGSMTSKILSDVAGKQTICKRGMKLADLCNPQNSEIIDRGLVLWMPGPHSFTGDDCGEFHVHGGQAVVAAVLRILEQYEDTRPAEAGEFIRRAFANDRMDLLEVEGIADLIAAQTQEQHKLAIKVADGRASKQVEDWRTQLIQLMSRVEAAVDFVDEEGVADEAIAAISDRAQQLEDTFAKQIKAMQWSERLRDGFRIAIAGPANAGKSSLLNWLAGREAAIVSDIAGTTRDLIEVHLDFDGVPVTVIDMAGLRLDSVDEIELIGMDRAHKEIQKADMVFWLGSADTSLEVVPKEIDSDVLWLWNKCDSAGMTDAAAELARQHDAQWFEISVRSGVGLEELVQTTSKKLRQDFTIGETSLFSHVRQRHALSQALSGLRNMRLNPDAGLEIKAEYLRQAAHGLAVLSGRIDIEDLLDDIFSQFCIGK